MAGISSYQTASGDAGSGLVKQHALLVKRIAQHLMARLPASVQLDDLIQSGMVGLLEAARNYDASKGASFETYAGIRIRGTMLDEVRKGDWIPRSVHRNSRRVAAAVRQVERTTGEAARGEQVAKAMDVSLDEYYGMLKDVSGCRLLDLHDLGVYDNGIGQESVAANFPGPLEGVQYQVFKGHLAETINKLPDRERMVLILYYDEELNLREIGEVLGVSESRVSQIHSQAVIRLKSRMSGWS